MSGLADLPWFPKTKEDLGPLAPCPDWLIKYFKDQENSPENIRYRQRIEAGELIADGRRNSVLASMAGHMRRAGFDQDAIFDALWTTNENRCAPPLDVAEVEGIAESIATRYAPDPLVNVRITTGKNGDGDGEEPLLRVPASKLRKLGAQEKWLWHGLIPAEMVTILSALPKAGKTTLMAHLMHTLATGGTFCGLDVRPARIVCVTEESETIWADRRDRIGLADHCEFVLRPFRSKPTRVQWLDLLKRAEDSLARKPADFLIIDTLAKLWPVQNENDASEVTDALMPLQEIAYGLHTTEMLVHHLRKGDGQEGTQTRGSGGITAAVDCILELRRYKPGDRKDRRRVLSCDARWDDCLSEVVVELAPDGLSYQAHGDREDTASREIANTLLTILPTIPPGWTIEEITENWPDDGGPRRKGLNTTLKCLIETNTIQVFGRGQKGSPYTYVRVSI